MSSGDPVPEVAGGEQIFADLIDFVGKNAYYDEVHGEGVMKQSEFRRWLAAQGATFKDGARHLKVFLNGKQTVLPRHPNHEIGEGLRLAILKQLGLK